jgi:hypothetical protein
MIKKINRPRYPDNWKEISDRVRFSRAEGRCECRGECGVDHRFGRCTAIHSQAHPTNEFKVSLATAHLDHNPENNSDDNLKAFCQACHLRYDRLHHRKERYKTRRSRKAYKDLFEDE